MKLIVGLGNVGASYSLTRHNIGFMAIDAIAETLQFKKTNLSLVQKINIENQPVLLAKPQTQMNLSGKSVQELLSYYKLEVEDLLVVHDDMDLDFLKMKFQKSRGAGGHNGIQNIHDLLGHSDYFRLKLGVGRPISPLQKHESSIKASGRIIPQRPQISTSNYVLSPFEKDQLEDLEKFLIKSTEAMKHFVLQGGESARNIYNQDSKDL